MRESLVRVTVRMSMLLLLAGLPAMGCAVVSAQPPVCAEQTTCGQCRSNTGCGWCAPADGSAAKCVENPGDTTSPPAQCTSIVPYGATCPPVRP